MLTSGMTGYAPNRSDSAISDSWSGEFIRIGNPHMNDESCASFNSQISKIFKAESTDGLFVAMADRCLPNYPVDRRRADIFTRTIAGRYDPQRYNATPEETAETIAGNALETADTSISDYVWLPLRVKAPDAQHPNGQVGIEWENSWCIIA